MHFLMLPVSVSPNLQFIVLAIGLGRRKEFHFPAPVVAKRAPLRALGFSSLTHLAMRHEPSGSCESSRWGWRPDVT